MPYQIALQPGGQTFSASSDQTILDAALAAGVQLPYGCRDGVCGVCKGKVLSGETEAGKFSSSALDDAERAAGYALFCRTQPRSDLVLEARTIGGADRIRAKKMPCRVRKMTRAADDVMVIELTLPGGEPFRFRAGQYIDILLADGQRRSFSIASASHAGDCIELHVRLIGGGRFTGHVFSAMKERDILRLEGPLGTFWLRENSPRPAILVAGGTGFAPMKSIIESAIHEKLSRPMTLYWGARDRAGLYMDALAREWENLLPGFRYIPVLSEAKDDGVWNGRRGLVTEAVLADAPDLSAYEVYACGAPQMISAARVAFSARGLPEDAFHADAFTFSNPEN